ncbi:hypothetical protein M1403_02855 [Patescibacteria group bacterium]|nr:hypothetical protein [Patescibacteria group bacterium]
MAEVIKTLEYKMGRLIINTRPGGGHLDRPHIIQPVNSAVINLVSNQPVLITMPEMAPVSRARRLFVTLQRLFQAS